MIFIITAIFTIICVASLSYDKGARTKHHDSRPDWFDATSHRKDN